MSLLYSLFQFVRTVLYTDITFFRCDLGYMSCIPISSRNPSNLVILFPRLQIRSRKLERKPLESSRFMVMEESEKKHTKRRLGIRKPSFPRPFGIEIKSLACLEILTVLYQHTLAVCNDGPRLSRKGQNRFSLLSSRRGHSS